MPFFFHQTTEDDEMSKDTDDAGISEDSDIALHVRKLDAVTTGTVNWKAKWCFTSLLSGMYHVDIPQTPEVRRICGTSMSATCWKQMVIIAL